MKKSTETEKALFRGRIYTLHYTRGGYYITDEDGNIIIPDAKNTWEDLLDHFVKEERYV